MIELDPKLSRALESATDSLKVVIALKNKTAKPLDADETRASVTRLVEKTKKKTKKAPSDLVVFPNIQSFSIEAEPGFMRQLLNEDDVAAAMYNGA